MKFANQRLPGLFIVLVVGVLLTGCQSWGGGESTPSSVAISTAEPSATTESAGAVQSVPIDSSEPPVANQVTTQISWTIPSTRILGDFLPLSELQGYTIYYGTAPGKYTNSIQIQDAQQTSTGITLDSGQTYYFVVRAIDTDGLEGPESNTVVRTI